MYKEFARLCVFAAVIGTWVVSGQNASAQTGNDPKVAVVNVLNADSSQPDGNTLIFQAYIVGREGEQITTNTGAGTGGFQFDLAAFATQWAAGETLTVDVQNPGNGQAGSDSVLLDPVSAILNVQLGSEGACTYSLPTSGGSHASALDSGSFAVEAADGCTWTASTVDGWLSVTSGSPGSGDGSVNYAVTANASSIPRAGTISVTGDSGATTPLLFTVDQGGVACTYTLTSSFANVDETAHNNRLVSIITPASDCDWSASTVASWITITSGDDYSGPDNVIYNVAANPLSTPRTGTITIAGQDFTVNQSGVACSYTVDLTSHSVGPGAGSGTVSVTANASDCVWTASSDATAWLTVGPGGSGTVGVTYNFTANPSSNPRSGELTVAGETVTITQAGIPCNLGILPSGKNYTAAGGTGSLSVSAAANDCNWTAVSNNGWITVTDGDDGSGPGTVSYSIDAYILSATRIGTITAAGQTFTVNQSGVPCLFSVSPASENYAASGGTGSVNVTPAAQDCNWTAVSNDAWITVTGGANGLGGGTVSYSITANPLETPRTGTLTIAGETFTVSQSGVLCTYELSPTAEIYPASGGIGSVALTTSNQDCEWTASANADWITVTGGGSGTGNGSVSYAVSVNPTTALRSGTITIAGETFTVNQSRAGCAFELNELSATYAIAGGSGSVIVIASNADCAWTAQSHAAWLTVTGGGSGVGYGRVDYSVAPNPAGGPRSGTLTIAGKTFTVNQLGGSCTYGLSPANRSHAAAGGSGTVSVTTNDPNCPWSAVANQGWVTVTGGSSGTGNGTVAYSLDENPTPNPRAGAVTIAGKSFVIYQSGGVASMTPGNNEVISGTYRPTFNWLSTSSATWYQVWIGKKQGGVFKKYYSQWLEQTSTSWTPGIDLTCGEYAWWVRPWDPVNKNGAWQGPAYFEMACCDVVQPVLIDPLDCQPTGGSLTYRWESQPCATWYQLRVNKGDAKFYIKWIETGLQQAPIEHEVNGHTPGLFEWWVRAWNPEGYGNWSSGTPFGIGLVDPLSLSSTQLCWDESCLGDATWVQVWINRGNLNVIKQWVELSSLAGNCYDLAQPLQPGVHTVWIRSWNAQDKSGPWSPGIPFTVNP